MKYIKLIDGLEKKLWILLRDKNENVYSKINLTHLPILNDNLKDILYNLPLEPKIDSLDDMCMWGNISPKGSHMGVHNHSDCDLAGVYYVKVPKGDCGNIGFHDNRPVLFGNSFIVDTTKQNYFSAYRHGFDEIHEEE